MKRSIFIAVLGMGSVAAFGQGKTDFTNYGNSTDGPRVKYAISGVAIGSSFSAELLYYVGTSGSDVPTLLSQFTSLSSSITPFGTSIDSGSNADGSAYAGYFEGGTVQIPGVSGAQGNNNFVSFVVEAFNGTSYSALNTTFNGVSAIFQSPLTPDSGSPVVNINQGAWRNFTVAAVPEPTTLALAGLGGLASLVMLRRKTA